MSEYNRGMGVEDVVLETLKHLGCRSSGKLTKETDKDQQL